MLSVSSRGKILAARTYCGMGADHLIGIALVVIGALALVGLPHLGALSSMPEWAKYGLIGVGGAYLIGTCVADAKLIHAKLKKKEEPREIQEAPSNSRSIPSPPRSTAEDPESDDSGESPFT